MVVTHVALFMKVLKFFKNSLSYYIQERDKTRNWGNLE
jgi:hypothetical protein